MRRLHFNLCYTGPESYKSPLGKENNCKSSRIGEEPVKGKKGKKQKPKKK